MQENRPTHDEKKYKWCKRILVFDHDHPLHAPLRSSDSQGRGDAEAVRAEPGADQERSSRPGAPSSTGREGYSAIPGLPSTSTSFPRTSRISTRRSMASSKLLELDREEVIAKLKDARDFPSSFSCEDRIGHVHGPGGEGRGKQVLSPRCHDPDRAEKKLSLRHHARPCPRLRLGNQQRRAEEHGVQGLLRRAMP